MNVKFVRLNDMLLQCFRPVYLDNINVLCKRTLPSFLGLARQLPTFPLHL